MLPAGAALAGDTCSGTMFSGALGPLPKSITIGLLLRDDSPRNLAMAQRFKDGLASGGARVEGIANTQLAITAQFYPANSNFRNNLPTQPAGRATFDWGGIPRTAPDQTRMDIRRGSNGGGGATVLVLRADLRPADSGRVAWSATVRCDVQTTDMNQLAFDLGALLGPTIGKSTPNRNF